MTGTPVELEVTALRASRIAPGEDVYVSFFIPSRSFTCDVRLTFYDHVLFFDGRQSAELRTAEHPGTTPLPLDDAAAIGRLQGERLCKDASAQAA